MGRQRAGRGGTADATDLKSVGPKGPCGFDSRRPDTEEDSQMHGGRLRPPCDPPEIRLDSASCGGLLEDLFMAAPVIHPETRIGHVHLKVADLERALGFYHGVLGFEVT